MTEHQLSAHGANHAGFTVSVGRVEPAEGATHGLGIISQPSPAGRGLFCCHKSSGTRLGVSQLISTPRTARLTGRVLRNLTIMAGISSGGPATAHVVTRPLPSCKTLYLACQVWC